MQIAKQEFDNLNARIEALTSQRNEAVAALAGHAGDKQGYTVVLDAILGELQPVREYRWHAEGGEIGSTPMRVSPACSAPVELSEGERHDETVRRLSNHVAWLEGRLAAADAVARFAKANVG